MPDPTEFLPPGEIPNRPPNGLPYEATPRARVGEPACADCGGEVPPAAPGPPARPEDVPLCRRCFGERARKGERVTEGPQRHA